MKTYEFNYKDGSYMLSNSPGFNPLWAVVIAILVMAVILSIYY